MTEAQLLRKILVELRVMNRLQAAGSLTADELNKWRQRESRKLTDEIIDEMVGE